jgi:nicotinate dehydrogenase subunit B
MNGKNLRISALYRVRDRGTGRRGDVLLAAAIANAIFDANGIRMRQIPFTPEPLKAGFVG